MYRTLIRCKLDYGSIVYNSAQKSTLKQLDIIHNAALRIALGAFCTSPIDSLNCESGEPSLADRRKYLTLSYASKISAYPNNPVHRHVFAKRFQETFNHRKQISLPFYERVNRILGELNLTLPETINPTEIITPPPWTIHIPSTILDLSHLKKSENHPLLLKKLFLETIKKFEKFQCIYTNASHSESGVGAAYTTIESFAKFQLPPFTTIFTAELIAICEALRHLNTKPTSNWIIVSDSLSAIQSLSQLYPTHPSLIEIKSELQISQKKNSNVQFLWCPSHIGIEGNEKADRLAREAASGDGSTYQITKSIHQDIKPALKKNLTLHWQQKWDTSNSKLFRVKPFVSPWKIIP
ncbi:uncharacterized protein [Leptinotarsa decemlineata]|uniref:uncharacterized protein n=1 Tax=Leptinotarsa decemlineata TaxID=7539 RepID=UPI003D3045C4